MENKITIDRYIIECSYYCDDFLEEHHQICSIYNNNFCKSFADAISRIIHVNSIPGNGDFDEIMEYIIENIPGYTDDKYLTIFSRLKVLIDCMFEVDTDVDKEFDKLEKWIKKQIEYYKIKTMKEKGGKEAIGKQIDVIG